MSLSILKSKILDPKYMMIIHSLTAIIWKIRVFLTMKKIINPKQRTLKCSKIHLNSYLHPIMKVKNARIYLISSNQDNTIKQGRHTNSIIKMTP
jgi:hypothetical protein